MFPLSFWKLSVASLKHIMLPIIIEFSFRVFLYCIDCITYKSVEDAAKAALFNVWGSGKQLLENYPLCFHRAMTSTHKSSSYIEIALFQAQSRVSQEMLMLSSMIHIRDITWANCAYVH